MRPTVLGILVIALTVGATQMAAQTPARPPASAAAEAAQKSLPPGYVIGASDVLSIVFYGDKEMSADVIVRPDGKISVPLINEVNAAGVTPEELRVRLLEAASKLVEDPDVSVLVKDIRSRNVYITGNVAKPATYPMIGEMNVLQLIAVSGGLLEYADKKEIAIIRTENGKQQRFKFNYNEVVAGKRTADNIALKPGDIVVVR
jgi:polysaccharide biosynthesis/export protein